MCPKLIELLSWNGPTVHVCCFMLPRASTKKFVSRIHIHQPSPKDSEKKSSLAEKFVSRVTRQPRYHCTGHVSFRPLQCHSRTRPEDNTRRIMLRGLAQIKLESSGREICLQQRLLRDNNTTLTRDKQRAMLPQFLQTSGRTPTPQTGLPVGSAILLPKGRK